MQSKHGARPSLATQRAARIMELRVRGMTQNAIAAEIGVSRGCVRMALEREFARLHKDIDHWRILLCEQSMKLLEAWWPKALTDLDALQAVRDLQGDIRKTMGLESQHNTLIVNNVDADTYIEQQIQALANLAGGGKTEADKEAESAHRIIDAPSEIGRPATETGGADPVVSAPTVAEASTIPQP